MGLDSIGLCLLCTCIPAYRHVNIGLNYVHKSSFRNNWGWKLRNSLLQMYWVYWLCVLMLQSYSALRTFTQKIISICPHFPEIFIKMYRPYGHSTHMEHRNWKFSKFNQNRTKSSISMFKTRNNWTYGLKFGLGPLLPRSATPSVFHSQGPPLPGSATPRVRHS